MRVKQQARFNAWRSASRALTWPYVMIVTLMPPRAASTSGLAVLLKISSCPALPPNTESKVKLACRSAGRTLYSS